MPISCRVRKACTLRPKLERSLGEEYLAIPMCPEQDLNLYAVAGTRP